MSRRRGTTLIELVAVLLVIGIVAGIVVYQARGANASAVDDAARWFARAIQAARADAIMHAEAAAIVLDTTARDGSLGRYVTVRVPTGADTAGLMPDQWHELTRGVQFGAGAATVGPLGDAITSAVPLTFVTCDASGACVLGGAPVVTYYLTAVSDPTVVRAVTLTAGGHVRFFRYRPTEAAWE